jgi:PGF-pre-PGF domain-containing protein
MKKILAILMVAFLAGAAAAQTPSLPHVFDGEVSVNGDSYSGEVEARYQGKTVDTVKADETFEDLLVSGVPEGSEVKFYVDGIYTGQSRQYVAGDISQLDLSVEIDGPVKISKNFGRVSSGDDIVIEVPEVAARNAGSVNEVTFDTSNVNEKDIESNVTVMDEVPEVDEKDGVNFVDEFFTVEVKHNLEGDENQGGKITFRVEDNEVENEGVVKLYKEVDEQEFEVVDTEFVEEEDGFYVYEASAESYSTFVVAEDTQDPEADAGDGETVDVDEVVTLDGSESSDNREISSYEWDLGDGETAEGDIVTHTYDEADTYTATLTVTDEAGNSDTDEVEIVVEPEPGASSDGGSGTFNADVDFEWSAESLNVEFEDETNTFDREAESYDWEFGDGETGSGETVDHTYEESGEYDVTLTVTDDEGDDHSMTQTVEVEEAETEEEPESGPEDDEEETQGEEESTQDTGPPTDAPAQAQGLTGQFTEAASNPVTVLAALLALLTGYAVYTGRHEVILQKIKALSP